MTGQIDAAQVGAGEESQAASSGFSIEVVQHSSLTPADLEDLRRLFDHEYLADFGPWDPHQPYGYARHDVHVIAHSAGSVVGHAGWAARSIDVGHAQVMIAGVGGVLISQTARGSGLGRQIMARVAESMAEAGTIEFGYLGCREEVVQFYASCGWERISAVERSISRSGTLVTEMPGPPLLILPIARSVSTWPVGAIDLRGRAW